MTGWIGDFFRFWWASFYWNFRKTWFRLRGAQRDDCPCQTYGDSGHALDARCDAVIPWHEPARFRRVCPLLTATKDGWRCGVDAERVRPFWGRAWLHAGALLLVLYVAGTLAVFATLRLAHYPTGYLAVLWPGRWRELRVAQEHLYAAQARAALDRGNYQEAMLALDMVCQLNPRNYEAGRALAGLALAAAQPFISDQIYERLLRDVPERRPQTAEAWYRTLLARGAYGQIKPLAAAMLREDAGNRAAWLHALLFAARQSGDGAFLATIGPAGPALPEWCTEAIAVELLLLEKKNAQALARLVHPFAQPGGTYLPYFQIDRLLRLGQPDAANALLDAYGHAIAIDDTAFLRLRVFQAKGWDSLVDSEFEHLLQLPISPGLAGKFCGYLAAHPDPRYFARYGDRILNHGLELDAATLPAYQATYLVATLAGDKTRAGRILAAITPFTASDAKILRGLGDVLAAGKPDARLTRMLPLVALPTEVVYALLERLPPIASP